LDIATATLKITAPVMPAELIKAGARAAAGGQTGWLSKLGVRLFRPRLWFLLNLTSKANHGTEVVRHAARLFGFAGKDATQPVEFLARVGQTSRVALVHIASRCCLDECVERTLSYQAHYHAE